MRKTNIKTTATALRTSALIGCSLLTLSLTSCDGKDDPNDNAPQRGKFFLSVTGEERQYILQTDDVETTGELSIANGRELEQSGYTWIFNSNPSVAIGLIYQQGDPGIGLGFTFDENGTLKNTGQFQITSRFTSYGFFGRYALTCVGGVTPVNAPGDTLVDGSGKNRTDGVTFNFIDLTNNFALTDKTITTLNITGNGEQATFSGIVDMGNGEFLTGLVVSQPRAAGATGGASSGAITYPDSVWVAAYDADLNLKRIYRDNRLSYSSGRFRSQYYSQLGKADDGSVYVFSGSYESTTTKPCGALRINKNAAAFDPSYYFNIEEKTDGYRFRKVWHVAGSYFMLELYNDDKNTPITVSSAATQYGIVDMASKTFKWVTGIPAKGQITGTGLPAAYNGKMYFPITATGADPAIYIIDPATAVGAKGVSITGASAINAVGRLSY
ncbi:MAG: DUF4374 domain-containing protein [Prevotellaceae bacterium]|jgi:hypothetical protein|nr:DUF4374 domain-containing protein [Prevotellaceae bacterium]